MSQTTPPRKRLFMRTWGCQMNVYDSARMADVLAPLGYEPAEAPDGADMVILNTCHIREKASEKLFSELGRLRALKREREAAGGRMVLAVAGCVAQAEGAEITARAPWVDIVLGPQTYHRLPEMVARASRAAGAVIDTDFPGRAKFDRLPEAAAAPQGRHRFLTVQEGCDKFCSFCVVPYTRGRRVFPPRRFRAGGGAAAGGAGRARDHPARAERERLPRRGAGRRRRHLGPRAAVARVGRDPRPRAAPLHHQPPAGRGRRAGRGAPRPAAAHARSCTCPCNRAATAFWRR
jgi:hypothetical protein